VCGVRPRGGLGAAIGIPSFIVTLALFLAWQGVLLFVLNSHPIGVNGYPIWFGLAHANMSPAWSWVFTIGVTGDDLLYTVVKSVRGQARGLAADTLQLVLVRGLAIMAVASVITVAANENRNTNPFLVIDGLPWALTIPIMLMIVCTIALNRTTWGRHLFATGGSAAAARRAGIDVTTSRSRRSPSVPRWARWAASSSPPAPVEPNSTSERATSCCSRSRPPSSEACRCSVAAADR
jgi:D-xylose transport system permease protein